LIPNGVDVEVAVQYNDGFVENVFAFANNINTMEGGTHLTGFRSALTRTFNNYAQANGLFKKDKFTLSGEDVREGLTAVVSVKLKEPQFEGQTKTKLGNSEVKGIVEAMVNESLGAFLEENPPVARRIAELRAGHLVLNYDDDEKRIEKETGLTTKYALDTSPLVRLFMKTREVEP